MSSRDMVRIELRGEEIWVSEERLRRLLRQVVREGDSADRCVASAVLSAIWREVMAGEAQSA